MLKMNTKSLFVVLLLCCVTLARGQKRFTYIGVEAGPNYGIFKFTDTGGFLYTKTQYDKPYIALRLEQELTRAFSISVGVLKHNYSTNFRFTNDESYSSYIAMQNLHIPVRLSYTIPIKFGVPEVRFTPFIGAHYVKNRAFGRLDTIKERLTPNFSNYFTGKINGLSSSYTLLETGAGIDFMFQKGLTMSVNGFYAHGLKAAAKVDLTYHVNPLDPKESQTATVTTSGSYFGFSIGFRYPISRFWQRLNPVKADKGKDKIKEMPKETPK
jgi:hypothetical protein